MVHTEKAYAKLNLSLDILGKRSDGFHDMRMVMQSIDLADTITISVQQEPGLCLTADLPFLPKGSGNIAAKAAARFFEQTRLPVPGLAIDIQKRIPVCAGMAGGSSDGAAVLRLLRRICSPELSRERLEEIGALTGSDVPYCVRGGAVLAEGRGERLTDLPDLPCCWLVVDISAPVAQNRMFRSSPRSILPSRWPHSTPAEQPQPEPPACMSCFSRS